VKLWHHGWTHHEMSTQEWTVPRETPCPTFSIPPVQAAAAFVPPAVVPPAAPAAAAPAATAAAVAIPTMGILRTEERAQIRKARVSAAVAALTLTITQLNKSSLRMGADAQGQGFLRRKWSLALLMYDRVCCCKQDSKSLMRDPCSSTQRCCHGRVQHHAGVCCTYSCNVMPPVVLEMWLSGNRGRVRHG